LKGEEEKEEEEEEDVVTVVAVPRSWRCAGLLSCPQINWGWRDEQQGSLPSSNDQAQYQGRESESSGDREERCR
jgi:hypothetical protein